MNLKQKFVAFSLIASLSLSLAACGGSGSSSAAASSTSSPASSVAAETAESSAAPEEAAASNTTGEAADATGADRFGKVLIVYFSVVENNGLGPDAVASASVVSTSDQRGRVRAIADEIEAQLGGDVFSIQTSVEYPDDADSLLPFAQQEQRQHQNPELTAHIENLDEYDTIFIGYPTWWYDLPQIMYAFFDEYDFSGKTIIPFNSANGSRFSGTIQTIKELEPNATVVENGLSVHERDIGNVASLVADWLAELQA